VLHFKFVHRKISTLTFQTDRVYCCPILVDKGIADENLVKHSNMQQLRENMLSGCGFVA
jgi:hypothetical protein